MILTIYPYNSLSFKNVAKKIDATYPNLKTLINDMWETMYAINAAGLTAQQVGRPIRIMVIDALSIFIEDGAEIENTKVLMINPQIIESSGISISFVEGCCPGNLKSSWVRVKYIEGDFVEHDKIFHGVIARIIQQKYEYLEGKMFIDILSSIQKKVIDVDKYDFTLY